MKKFLYIPALLFSNFLIAQDYVTNTKGELEVSDAGVANYTISIANPPSIENYAPNVSLVYTNCKRGGIAGQGWDVTGISSITRIATRRDIDGFIDGVDFDNNDKLALDGQRLLIKTGNYWENESTYQTEIKSNLKIELKIVNLRTYFIVTNVDGARTWYGSTGNGSNYYATANAWYIIRSEDVYGNSIIYSYNAYTDDQNHAPQLYVDNIKFSGNESQSISHVNTIYFTYAPRQRVEVDYIKGEPLYATQTLDEINVYTQGNPFKKYKISHNTQIFSGYEHVSQIQEFNGSGDASNPILFDYYDSPLNAHRDERFYPNILDFTRVKFSGDFDGDGRLDFVADDHLFTKLHNESLGALPISLPDDMKFAATTLKNNKINQFQSLVAYNESGTENLNFNVYNFNPATSTVEYEYNKSFPILSVDDVTVLNPLPPLLPCGVTGMRISPATFKFSGDFNGDGITEVIFSQHDCTKTIVPEIRQFPSPHVDCNELTSNCSLEKFFLADLNQNSTAAPNSQGFSEILDWDTVFPASNFYTQSYVLDFNGDGKADIMRIFGGQQYIITTINETSAAPFHQCEKIGWGSLDRYSQTKQILFGDYNGDGKADIMIPDTEGYHLSYFWNIYYSRGINASDGFFEQHGSMTPIEYWPHVVDDTYETIRRYYAIDINKDGKSDMVEVEMKKFKDNPSFNDYDTEYSVAFFTNDIGVPGNAWFSPMWWSGNMSSQSPDLPTPIPASYQYQGKNTEFLMARGRSNFIDYYSFDKDFDSDNRLRSVTESAGHIKQTIEYEPMQSSDGMLGNPATDFYSSGNTAQYPDVELIKNPQAHLVSKLTATVNGASKFQKFRYYGYTANFDYGNIGYLRTARSGWYLSDSDPKIWTVKYNNPGIRGANTITYTTTDDNTVLNAPPGGIISTKTNKFITYTNPVTKVYNVLLNQQTFKDELTGVTVIQDYLYDGTVQSANYYALQTQNTASYYNGTVLQGKTITSYTEDDGSPSYDSNPNGVGNDYHIGKPLRTKVTKIIYGASGQPYDTRTSEERLHYSPGPDVSQSDKKGNGTDAITEKYTYNSIGNLTQKEVSMPTSTLASRTISDEYDPETQRFVIKKTDHQGFETFLEYNEFGLVVKSTDHMGFQTGFEYDHWGRLDNSGVQNVSMIPLLTDTFYNVLPDGGYMVGSTDNIQGFNTTYYDVLGRVTQTRTKGLAANSYINVYKEYDGLGRVYRESEPSFTTAQRWAKTYQYDDLSRVVKITAASGREQIIEYSGLTATVHDGDKTTSVTTDAMGNKVFAHDDGGDIAYKYFATGALMKTTYGANEIVNDIDGWGNKKSTLDPNAGTTAYTYEYDGFGQLRLETTPKGSTEYTYDDYGKLTQKRVSGDGADFVTDYDYNTLGQLKKETTATAANLPVDTFEYTYDNTFHRLNITKETSATIEQTKTLVYDAFGRIASETNLTKEKVSGTDFTASVTTSNLYNGYNGMLYKIIDQNNVAVWQLDTANALMQPLTETLGNGVSINNTYSENHYLILQEHKKNATYVMQNANVFDEVKGLLNSRQNITLGIAEEFKYDPQDRLWRWGDPDSMPNPVQHINQYDDQGRITYNNKVGEVRYNTNAATGIYRKDNIKFNPSGKQYYGALGGSQTVSYTMFKSPIDINESNKGKINFKYNSHLSRTRMDYDYGLIAPNTVKEKRKTKLYTDDGSAEVIIDNNAHTVTINTFIGGDAYSAIAFSRTVKDLNTGTVTPAEKFYLHRDYLGSILAISNSSGVAVEKRHFDAWGNLTKVVGINGVLPVANGLQFLDRGYTGHEHLKEVRLIHMNGRLYDPVLRSFLMPDNFVQAPENTQSYNRYAYCMNNPLSYNDPSGETYELLTAVIIGVVVAALSYTATVLFSGATFSWGDFAQGVVIGAMSAAVTFGIGSACTSLMSTSCYVVKAGVQAVAHGAFQGMMSAATGGSFWTGFAAGALSSIAASAWTGGDPSQCEWQGLGGKFADSGLGMVAFGTVAGGAGAELTGGNFWVGAATGLVVSACNHYMHEIKQNKYAQGAKEYIATVSSESSSDEAEGIGSVIINRATDEGIQIEAGFIDKIGGAKDFQGIVDNSKDYNRVMNMSLKEIANTTPGQDYYLRFKGALTALYKAAAGLPLVTKGFFWNASWQQYKSNPGYNFRQLNNGIYAIDTVIGATTFFKYSNVNKHWP